MSAAGERGENLVLLREAAHALLREDELAVGKHVELAVRALAGGRGDAVVVQDGRETRGPTVVPASDGAVVDLDGHGRTLSEARPVPVDDRRELEPGRQRAVDRAAVAEAGGAEGVGDGG